MSKHCLASDTVQEVVHLEDAQCGVADFFEQRVSQDDDVVWFDQNSLRWILESFVQVNPH